MFCDIWEAGDSWGGISDQARRKRLQNKINQRAWRRRRNQNHSKHSSSYAEADIATNVTEPDMGTADAV
ncbi:hypothetical protein CH063_10951, partial [Colletotrichum higginsianum]